MDLSPTVKKLPRIAHHRARALSLLLCLYITIAPAAYAAERITQFDSVVRILADGTAEVTETIDFIAEGKLITKGISRHFITRIFLRPNQPFSTPIDLHNVTLDGQPTAFHIVDTQQGKRVVTGDANTLLTHGKHRIVLYYLARNNIHFYPEYDEFFWMVTGLAWPFPIEHARVRLFLPEGGKILQITSYTGVFGSQTSDANTLRENDGIASVNTTRPLDLGESLNVAVTWQKGIIMPPSTTRLRLEMMYEKFIYAPTTYVVSAVGVLFLTVSGWWYKRRKRGIKIR